MTRAAWNEARAREIVAAHRGAEGAGLPILRALQQAFGFVPEATLPMIAEALNLTRAYLDSGGAGLDQLVRRAVATQRGVRALSNAIAATPKPPYYAVIFTSVRNDGDNGYAEAADRMAALSAAQPGFLGMEHAREGVGITICYWDSLEAIAAWKKNAEHQAAQERGKTEWYVSYRVRICKVEREG